MPLPPRDPFADYLEGHDLLLKLERKRARVEEARAQGRLSEAESEQAIQSVLHAVERTVFLIAAYEEELEQQLQSLAERAEEGRTLFLSISEKVAALRRLEPSDWERCTAEEHGEWQRLLALYGNLRELWYRTLSAEERDLLREWERGEAGQ
jgi:hypothetical protein